MSERTVLVIRWSLLAVMCIVIFVFSGFPGHDSTEQSGGIVDALIRVLVDDLETKSPDEIHGMKEMLTIFVRKGAHFTEYALLACLAFSAFLRLKKRGLRWLAAVGFTCFYACTDELHQTFVPGRAGMVKDVILDTCGGVFGAVIACVISLIVAARIVLKRNSVE
ncbi:MULTISPECIES: VanZ family protein [Ruminococcus]|uniref:VanZ-like protein n=1 Tax=Ruminococcus albus 8 TaxID=246199 RepID=E9SHW7_RUMAL|nr:MULTISPECIES: VanZ family protein [Ruminococcus]MBE6874391.1 VanZ family protein [Ruminococcus albus]EGC01153.1 VanZ-like protein [Ruminococcus albus 8]MBQ9543020.1 VanZ family protein [Ruminococcus sp.]MBR0530473.1 VanZ family protein [Ruminococcus sp.]MCC3349502.1 VanZ family protein [Ruminococcus albus 8]